jgi:hypothetical protein
MKIFRLFNFTKRQKFVFSVVILALGLFTSEFFHGVALMLFALVLSLLTAVLLYLSIRDDIRDTFHYPIFILPFFYTASFVLFYPLVPERLLTRIIITTFYSFGLYSLFLTQNIFAISVVRTINLMRSARIVSFVLTIVALFFLCNVIFSLRLPIFILPFIVFLMSMLLNFQSVWIFSLEKQFIPQALFLSGLVSLSLAELSLVLSMWPINAAIYSIFITGIFYAYSGLLHAWVEKRLFKGVLWEYIWVGFLSVIILIFFSKWGS